MPRTGEWDRERELEFELHELKKEIRQLVDDWRNYPEDRPLSNMVWGSDIMNWCADELEKMLKERKKCHDR